MKLHLHKTIEDCTASLESDGETINFGSLDSKKAKEIADNLREAADHLEKFVNKWDTYETT